MFKKWFVFMFRGIVIFALLFSCVSFNAFANKCIYSFSENNVVSPGSIFIVVDDVKWDCRIVKGKSGDFFSEFIGWGSNRICAKSKIEPVSFTLFNYPHRKGYEFRYDKSAQDFFSAYASTNGFILYDFKVLSAGGEKGYEYECGVIGKDGFGYLQLKVCKAGTYAMFTVIHCDDEDTDFSFRNEFYEDNWNLIRLAF